MQKNTYRTEDDDWEEIEQQVLSGRTPQARQNTQYDSPTQNVLRKPQKVTADETFDQQVTVNQQRRQQEKE